MSIQGASDGSGFWACTVNGIQPHSTYKLSFWTSRDIQQNRMYPEVEFLGRRILLDQIWFPGRVYPVEMFFESGERQGPQTLRLINEFPVAISFSHLELTELPPGGVPDKKCLPPARAGQYLPLGVYQAPPSSYGRVAAAGLDTVLVQPKPKDIAAAQRAGLACLIKAPQTEAEWLKFKTSLKRRQLTLLPRDGFYLADEPELRPVPPRGNRGPPPTRQK